MSGTTSEDLQATSLGASAASRSPPICLPPAGNVTDGSRGSADGASEAPAALSIGVGELPTDSSRQSQDETPRRLKTNGAAAEASMGTEEAVTAENEMLKKQLEAAWHLCNVLRTNRHEVELQAPIVRAPPQVTSPQRDTRSMSMDHAMRGSFGESSHIQGGSVPHATLSPRCGQGSNGTLSTPSGPLFTPRCGQGSTGRRAPLTATPATSTPGSMRLPMPQQSTMLAASSGMTLVYQPQLPVQAHTAQPQTQASLGQGQLATLLQQPPQGKRHVERMVSSPLPSTPGRRAWSYAG